MRSATISLAMLVTACLALPAPSQADELAEAMQRADALSFFNRLGLQTSQLQRMVSPLKRIQQIVTQREADREVKLTRLSGYYQRARGLLIAGVALPEDLRAEIQKAEEEMAAGDLSAKQAVHGQMELIASILYPAQNAQLDWTPPPEVRVEESPAERARRQRQIIGLITEAGQFLQQVRELNALLYVTQRIPLISEYLAQYFPVNTPAFERAHAMLMDYTGEVRLVEEGQWQQQAPLYAERMVRLLGLMPEQAKPNPNAVGWSQLYDLLTNPQTVNIVQEMLDARQAED